MTTPVTFYGVSKRTFFLTMFLVCCAAAGAMHTYGRYVTNDGVNVGDLGMMRTTHYLYADSNASWKNSIIGVADFSSDWRVYALEAEPDVRSVRHFVTMQVRPGGSHMECDVPVNASYVVNQVVDGTAIVFIYSTRFAVEGEFTCQTGTAFEIKTEEVADEMSYRQSSLNVLNFTSHLPLVDK